MRILSDEVTAKRSDRVRPCVRNFVARWSKGYLVKSLLLLLTLFFSSCAAPPKDTMASGSGTVRLQSFASIEATPNPVPAGQNIGTTTITWSTGNYSVGQVNVSVDGAPEKLFARGSAGSADAE